MKIGSQIINGFFEYNDQLEYTESDVIFYSGLDSEGNTVRRIFYVKTNALGIDPLKDLSEVYFVDYFKYVYGNSSILTKSTVLTYLRNIFVGINEDGTYERQVINLSNVTSINNSGIWQIADSDREVVVFKGSDKAYMLISSPTYLALRVGSVDSLGKITWGSLTDISSNMTSVASEYLNKLNSLEVLMRAKIEEVHDTMEALTQTFTEEYSEIFKLAKF